MIKLYGVPRSRAIRCIWMLEELELPYEIVPISFADGGTRKPEFLEINPNGHIPALEDGALRLCESMAINLYLARKYGSAKGLWPSSLEDEGRAFQWSLWAITEAEEPLLTAMMNRMLLPEAQRDAAKAADALTRFGKPLGILESTLATRAHLAGETFSVADLNLASVLLWTRFAGVDLAAYPRTSQWLADCTGRPALQRAQRK